MKGGIVRGLTHWPTGSSLEPGEPGWRREQGLPDNCSLPRLNDKGHEDQVRGPCLASVARESQASAEFLLCAQVMAQGGWDPSGKSDATLGWFTGTCPSLGCSTVAVIGKPQIIATPGSPLPPPALPLCRYMESHSRLPTLRSSFARPMG